MLIVLTGNNCKRNENMRSILRHDSLSMVHLLGKGNAGLVTLIESQESVQRW